MALSQERFDNFKQHRAVFVFEHPVSKDWIGIAMCDGEFMPIIDPKMIELIVNYRGNLKCDIRVESRSATGDIIKLHGFEWKQIKEWDSDIRYRFFYSARDHILAAEGHLWQITSKDRSSIINALYALAAKRRIPVNHKSTVRLFYKSLKLTIRAHIDPDKITMVDYTSNNTYTLNWVNNGDIEVFTGVPKLIPDKFHIIKPYKNAFVCTRCNNGYLDTINIKSFKGEMYNIPVHLITEFICKCM